MVKLRSMFHASLHPSAPWLADARAGIGHRWVGGEARRPRCPVREGANRTALDRQSRPLANVVVPLTCFLPLHRCRPISQCHRRRTVRRTRQCTQDVVDAGIHGSFPEKPPFAVSASYGYTPLRSFSLQRSRSAPFALKLKK